MANVLISGDYPERDGAVQPAPSPGPCPFLALSKQQKIPRYSQTRQDESMRKALTNLTPVKDDFRLADYAQSFNWEEIGKEFEQQLDNYTELPERTNPDGWYAVVFRSKRNVDCNNRDLFDADRDAYTEAYEATNHALLVYWFTTLDEDNNCLATCVWTSRDAARSVNCLPKHREAVKLSDGAYAHYKIDRCRIKWNSETRQLDVTPW